MEYKYRFYMEYSQNTFFPNLEYLFRRCSILYFENISFPLNINETRNGAYDDKYKNMERTLDYKPFDRGKISFEIIKYQNRGKKIVQRDRRISIWLEMIFVSKVYCIRIFPIKLQYIVYTWQGKMVEKIVAREATLPILCTITKNSFNPLK